MMKSLLIRHGFEAHRPCHTEYGYASEQYSRKHKGASLHLYKVKNCYYLNKLSCTNGFLRSKLLKQISSEVDLLCYIDNLVTIKPRTFNRKLYKWGFKNYRFNTFFSESRKVYMYETGPDYYNEEDRFFVLAEDFCGTPIFRGRSFNDCFEYLENEYKV